VKKSYFGWAFSLAAASLMLALAWTSATAQVKVEVTGKVITPPGAAAPKGLPPAGPKGPVPRMPDGKPDLSGIWNGQRPLPNQEPPVMLPWADKLTKERTENYSADDPEARCLPGGVPRAAPYHYQLVQTPKLLLMLFEGNIHSYRQMFLDRREHPKSAEPLWYGDSIGSWDGDTLVVDTVGFNDKFWFDMAGHPHTAQLQVVERYYRRDFGNLEIGITIVDPGTYRQPWVIQRVSSLETGMEMSEYVCNENNSDVLHLVGK
jgi:hypothetical protein